MRESTRRDVFMLFLPLLVHIHSRGVHIWNEITWRGFHEQHTRSIKYVIWSIRGAYFLLLQAVHSVKRYRDSEELTLISDLLQKDAHITQICAA